MLTATSAAAASCSVAYTPDSTKADPSRTDVVTTAYGGDGAHDPSQGSTQVAVISPTALARGAFVIAAKDAALGSAVAFWGGHWWALNGLDSGSAPARFKGFANQTPNNPPQCGDVWSAAAGGSSSPPANVPQFMEVVVTSRVGSARADTVSGDAAHVVVVKTDPGYGPDPDHPGTGTVVAQAC